MLNILPFGLVFAPVHGDRTVGMSIGSGPV
jgi:hypothetical protein